MTKQNIHSKIVMMSLCGLGIDPYTGISLPKCLEPWAKIQLSKSERKGLTFEQQQELRKQKYMEQKGDKP